MKKLKLRTKVLCSHKKNDTEARKWKLEGWEKNIIGQFLWFDAEKNETYLNLNLVDYIQNIFFNFFFYKYKFKNDYFIICYFLSFKV